MACRVVGMRDVACSGESCAESCAVGNVLARNMLDVVEDSEKEE